MVPLRPYLIAEFLFSLDLAALTSGSILVGGLAGGLGGGGGGAGFLFEKHIFFSLVVIN